MRRGVILGSILVVGAACGSTAATAGAPCGGAGAKTLAVDRVARIYASGGSVYGCTASSGHIYRLAADQSRPGQPRIGKVALAGVDAAYGETMSGVDTLSSQVIVRRLDDGATLHQVSATTEPTGPEFFQTVETIVVKPDGAVAWIADGGSIVRYTHHVELLRIDRRGEAQLDRGSGIYPPSLRLSASRLTWRDHGTLRAATLV